MINQHVHTLRHSHAARMRARTHTHTHTHKHANTNVSLLPHHTQIRWVCPNHMCWAPSGELICCGLIPTSWWNLFGKGGLSSLIFCELARTMQTIMNITDLILQDLISTRDCGSQYFLSAHPESFYLLLISTGIARPPSQGTGPNPTRDTVCFHSPRISQVSSSLCWGQDGR